MNTSVLMEDQLKRGLRPEISALLDRAYNVRVHDLSESIALARKAIDLCSADKSLADLQAKGLSHMSLFLMIRGEYDDAIRTAEQALEEFGQLGDEHGIAGAMYNVAGVYYKTNNFHSGLIYLVDCLAIYRKHQDYHNQARALKSIGTIYEYFGDTDRARGCYEECVECGQHIGDKNLISNAYNPLSGIYLNKGQTQKAMDLITRAMEMKKETGDIRGLAFSLYGRGKVYAHMQQYDKAKADYLQALNTHHEMGEKLGWGMAMIKLGQLYLDTQQFEACRETLLEALEFTVENKISFLNFKTYHKLYELSKAEQKSREALEYLELYLKERDHVINAQTLHVIEAYQNLAEKQSLEMEANLQKERWQISERKNRELDAFFLKVSHDLKGPISTIIGLGNVVKERISDEEALKYFDMYKKKVYHINNILDELVRITRVDHAGECREVIDFETIIKDSTEALVYLQNYSDVAVDFSVRVGSEFTAEWALINTIIQNLIENGIKYADLQKPTSWVKIAVEACDEAVTIQVQDNGIGMKEDVKQRAFEMFYKANKSALGSGLGLYLLYRAVEKLAGEVTLCSKLGEGTSVTVRLPKAR